MKIARIIEYFPPHIGGMERHGLILSQEQIKLGHEVDVFIGYGGNWKSDFKEAPKLDFHIYKAPFQWLPMYSKMRRLWFNFWASRMVVRNHKKNSYDIVHLHGDFIEAYFGGKLSKKLGIPAVITIHAGLNKRLVKPKNAKYFKNITKIICVSGEIKKDLLSMRLEPDRISVISSGIYLDEFKNIDENEIISLKNQYSKQIIISVGVLRINKGFTYLIESFRQIKEKIDSATLLIIGDGPEINNLKKQTTNISCIHFLGHRGHDKVIEYLKAADVFVLASISTYNDREGTPISIMEAMAAGLPIVTTKVGGNPYLVKDGVNGFLVSPGNFSELAEAITKLLNNCEISQKIGAQNLEDIKQKDWPIIAKKITKIYQSLL